MKDIRKPAVDGMFYPKKPETLIHDIDQYLSQTKTADSQKTPFALVVPHAGYSFSGGVAAEVYKSVKNKKIKKVILLGVAHHLFFKGVSVGDFTQYRTPLGDIDVDRNFNEQLLSSDYHFDFIKQAHYPEHSIEVQLPFLQHLLEPGFEIIPLLYGHLDEEVIQDSAKLITKLIENQNNMLIVCSTDLSHDHPYDEANIMDDKVVSYFENLDYHGLLKAAKNREIEACGISGLLTLIQIALNLNKSQSKVLKLTNSGEIVGDLTSRIVGYMSGIIGQ